MSFKNTTNGTTCFADRLYIHTFFGVLTNAMSPLRRSTKYVANVHEYKRPIMQIYIHTFFFVVILLVKHLQHI
jgi:hypothetical protein